MAHLTAAVENLTVLIHGKFLKAEDGDVWLLPVFSQLEETRKKLNEMYEP